MKHMNATQNLLMLMQQMSSAMSLPNVSSKPNQSSVSFEDMLNQASSAAPKADGPSPSRPARGAASRAHCMMTARRADGVPPAMRA